jgi:hypothetical protein
LRQRRIDASTLLLGVFLVAGAALYYAAGRGLSFYFDEWSFILQRQSNTAHAFLAPHNGHLSVIPVAIYKALWSTVGLRHYGPYRLVDIVLHLACVALLYVYARRRLGSALGLVVAVWLLLLGRAWQDLIWPFQIGYLGSLAAGMGMLLVLERRTRGGDIAASLLLGASLACSGIGVAFVVGALVLVTFQRPHASRYVALAVPLALYLAWYSHYGQNQARSSNLSAVPGYVYDSLAGSIGALSGLGLQPGRLIAGLALVAGGVWVYRRRPTRRWVVPASVLLTFWVLTAFSRAQYHEPAASRYLYPGGLLLLAVLADLLAGVRLRRVVLGLVAVGVVCALVSNLFALRDGAAGLRATDASVDAALGALEVEGMYAPPTLQPDPLRAPQITAKTYLRAVRVLGSPAVPPSLLGAQSPAARRVADMVLFAAVRSRMLGRGALRVGKTAPKIDGFGSGTVTKRAGCIRFVPVPGPAGPPAIDVVVSPGGLAVRTAGRVVLYFRRLSDAYGPEVAATRFGPVGLRPPSDRLAAPWRVRVVPKRPASVCSGEPAQ